MFPGSIRVIALLGIMKAGGAYVPLDTAYPVERIKTILDDTDAKVLIASETVETANFETAVPVLLIEQLLATPVDKIRKRFADMLFIHREQPECPKVF